MLLSPLVAASCKRYVIFNQIESYHNSSKLSPFQCNNMESQFYSTLHYVRYHVPVKSVLQTVTFGTSGTELNDMITWKIFSRNLFCRVSQRTCSCLGFCESEKNRNASKSGRILFSAFRWCHTRMQIMLSEISAELLSYFLTFHYLSSAVDNVRNDNVTDRETRKKAIKKTEKEPKKKVEKETNKSPSFWR